MTGEWQVSIYMKLKAGKSLTCTSNDVCRLPTYQGRRGGISHLERSKEPPRAVEGATSGGRKIHLGWSQEQPRAVA
jgi:hypothetical protein